MLLESVDEFLRFKQCKKGTLLSVCNNKQEQVQDVFGKPMTCGGGWKAQLQIYMQQMAILESTENTALIVDSCQLAGGQKDAIFTKVMLMYSEMVIFLVHEHTKIQKKQW
jgi:hypothetical protein